MQSMPITTGVVSSNLDQGEGGSPDPPVSPTNKTDRHDITEILVKAALNTIKQTKNKQTNQNITKINFLYCFIHILI